MSHSDTGFGILPPLVVVALVALVVLVFPVLGYTMDDAFISFRYANNLAEGYGIVWNPGESPPNEGYTSFLWVVLLAPLLALRNDPTIVADTINLLAVLLSALVCAYAAFDAFGTGSRTTGAVIAGVTGGLLLWNPDVAVHVVSGMETASAILLYTVFFLLTARYLRQASPKVAVSLGVVGLLCGLVRPEFNLSIAVGYAAVFALTSARAWLVAGASLHLLGGLAYFGWRLSYFGLPFPLPFYLKQIGNAEPLPGLRPTGSFLRAQWYLFPALALFLARLRTSLRVWVPAAAGVATHMTYFLFPAHIMGINYRFLFPVYPLLILFAVLGAATLAQHGARQSLTLSFVAVMTIAFTASQTIRVGPIQAGVREDTAAMERAHIALGRALALIADAGSKSIALGDAGAVPYYSGWRTIDTFGLNDRPVALARSRQRYEVPLILDREPDMIVLISAKREVFSPPLDHEQRLFDASYQRGYRLLGTVRAKDDYFLWVTMRPTRFATTVRALLLEKVPSFDASE